MLLALNTILALGLTVYLLQCKSINDRGTNTVTRFVRDVSANSGYNTILMISVSLTAGTLLLGAIFKCVYACIPSLLVIILSFILKNKSTKNKQRIEDSRVMTKASGKTVKAAGVGIVGVIAGAAILIWGFPVLAVGAVAAAVLGIIRVIGKAANSMKDVDCPDIKEEDFEEFNKVGEEIAKRVGINIKDPDKFIAAAERAGISCEGKDLSAIAERVIKNAPTAMLKELPGDMSTEDKAMAIMSGTVEVVSANGKEIITVET